MLFTFFFILRPMKLNIRNIIYTLLLCLLQTPLAYGQIEPPLPGPDIPPPPGLPIDGGVLLLLISGLMFGIKNKIKKK
jgi:hypothetical protein